MCYKLINVELFIINVAINATTSNYNSHAHEAYCCWIQLLLVHCHPFQHAFVSTLLLQLQLYEEERISNTANFVTMLKEIEQQYATVNFSRAKHCQLTSHDRQWYPLYLNASKSISFECHYVKFLNQLLTSFNKVVWLHPRIIR